MNSPRRRKQPVSADESDISRPKDSNQIDNPSISPKSESLIESYVKTKFEDSSPRFKKFIVRFVLSVFMLTLLPLLIFGNFLIFYAIILLIIIQCYREFVRVGYQQYRVHNLPLIRSLAYYILLTSCLFFTGEFPIRYLGSSLPINISYVLITYHKLISFCFFMFGVVVFVLTLKKSFYKMQFNLNGWCLIGSIIFTFSGRCLFNNLQSGVIWAMLPMILIVVNDIFAYLIGTYFGKTKLIKLSPNKTWEGFIGAFFVTLIFGVALTKISTHIPYFYCPYAFEYAKHDIAMTCKPPNFMELQTFQFPVALTLIIPDRISSISYYPIYIHTLVIAVFASLLSPFGGFFASGFKRAFKIKDFGDTIPGHGGVLDRMDCQLLITIFVFVYTNTFVSSGLLQNIVEDILKLEPDQQLQLYDMLRNALISNHIIEQ